MKKSLPFLFFSLCLILSGQSCFSASDRDAADGGQSWRQAVNRAYKNFPKGGKYQASAEASQALYSSCTWNEASRRMEIAPRQATPSYCSSACHLLLLHSLQKWEENQGRRMISDDAWKALAPRQGQHDGDGPWGWMNANGPGMALLVHKLDAGYSFENWENARPGDWMKLFWNDYIGKQEAGHLTMLVEDKGDSVTFWSSNIPDGYGTKTIPKSKVKRVIFTRITRPENFSRAANIGKEAWLEDLLKKNVSIQEVRTKCGMKRSS